jgi:ketosteroid isomerase-like protein
MLTVAERFVQALARRDRAGLLEVLAPDVDFRGMTPGRFWESSEAEDLVDRVLFSWFEEQDVVEEVLAVSRDWVVDRERIGWRLAVRCPDGKHVVEQQAYLSVADGRIAWLRVMCSGFRKVD